MNESPSFETDDPETSGEVGSNKAGQHEGDSAICFLSILSRLFYMQRVDDKLRDSLAWCARVDERITVSKGNIGQHDLDTPISASRRIAFTRPFESRGTQVPSPAISAGASRSAVRDYSANIARH